MVKRLESVDKKNRWKESLKGMSFRFRSFDMLLNEGEEEQKKLSNLCLSKCFFGIVLGVHLDR